jgi:hypothetical protein
MASQTLRASSLDCTTITVDLSSRWVNGLLSMEVGWKIVMLVDPPARAISDGSLSRANETERAAT